jgi:hypothetical protein
MLLYFIQLCAKLLDALLCCGQSSSGLLLIGPQLQYLLPGSPCTFSLAEKFNTQG